VYINLLFVARKRDVHIVDIPCRCCTSWWTVLSTLSTFSLFKAQGRGCRSATLTNS